MAAVPRVVSMNINRTYSANQEKDKDTKAKTTDGRDKMRLFLFISVLLISTNFAFAECTTYMQAFNKHQLVIKGMMDLNFQGKMNADIGDAIGKRMKEAQEPLDAGEFNKACEMYDSIIADYGFDTSFGEAPPKETTESGAESESSSSASDEASAAPSAAETAPASE